MVVVDSLVGIFLSIGNQDGMISYTHTTLSEVFEIVVVMLLN